MKNSNFTRVVILVSTLLLSALLPAFCDAMTSHIARLETVSG